MSEMPTLVPSAAFADKRTPRAYLRSWLEEEIANRPIVNTYELMDRAVAYFKQDPYMLEALLRYAVGEMLPGALRELLGTQRRQLKKGGEHLLADEKAFRRKMARWYEHTGGGDHKSILEMVKPELRYSAGERRARAEGEMKVANWEDDLANGLPDDSTPVGLHYSIAEQQQIWKRNWEVD